MGSGKKIDVTWKTGLDESDLYDIIESYSEGVGIVELARSYRVRTAAINAILAENGIPLRKTKTANTPIESRLHDALRVAGIGFTTQRRVAARYVADIVIHQAPVIIEADGERHRRDEQAVERDSVRDSIHEAAGYRIFHFSGNEINADAVACVSRVIEACGLVPDQEPVFDIRTKFSGPDHPRYVRYEFTCDYCGEKFIAKRQRRKYCSHEHYILGAVKGKPKSENVRAALSAANHRPMSAETREKISLARRGTRLTSEHRAKISAGVRAHQIKVESDLTRERESSAETTLPARLAASNKSVQASRPSTCSHRAGSSTRSTPSTKGGPAERSAGVNGTARGTPPHRRGIPVAPDARERVETVRAGSAKDSTAGHRARAGRRA